MSDRTHAVSAALGLAGLSCLAVGRIVYDRARADAEVIEIEPVDQPDPDRSH